MSNIKTNAEISAIRLAEQGSNPSSPASGYRLLFVKNDGVYAKDSAGNVVGPLTSGIVNPMTTAEDLIKGGASGVPARLAKGNDGDILTMASGAIVWAPNTGGSGALSLITDTTLSGDGTFTFSSIAGTYKHLMLIGRVRTDAAGASDQAVIRVGNGSVDTGANYSFQVRQTGSTDANNQSTTATSMTMGIVSGNGDTSGYFSTVRAMIEFYADTAQFRNFEVQSSAHGTAYRASHGGGIWRNAANAINVITVLPIPTGGTNFKAGSRLSLYGMS